MRAFIFVVRRNHPNVCVVSTVWIWLRAIAGKSNALTIWRPGRLIIVKIAGAYLRQRLCRHVKYINVGPATVQIANCVLFELQPIYDPRFRCLRFLVLLSPVFFLVLLFTFSFLQFLMLRLATHQQYSLACCRPLDIAHAFMRAATL